MKLVLGITDASGAPYAASALRFLKQAGIHTDVVFTKTGRLVWEHEIGPLPDGFHIWNPTDFTVPFASDSTRYDGMLVIPCSSGSLARMAHGLSIDLIGRAADVMLKERRPLVLVLREMPLSLVHLRNMTQLVEAGAVVMPASPSFYSKPATMDALVDTVVCRALDHLGVDNDLMTRWKSP